MISKIKNFKSLASSKARTDALEIVEAALSSIEARQVIQDTVTVVDGYLTVMGQRFTLSDYRNIYIIGFGKASCRAANVLEEVLQGQVKDGAVIGITEVTCSNIETYAGTHPMPSHINVTATKHIQEIAHKATKDDLVLVVISGGGSALLCSSEEECEQGKRLYEAFLHSGGMIEELNTVRKYISSLKGGGLAKILYPATVVSLIFSDVPGGDISSIASGPTFPPTSTVSDAEEIIKRYNLGSYQLSETKYEPTYFEKVHNILVSSNITALKAMEDAAAKRGYQATIISATKYSTIDETKDTLFTQSAVNLVRCMGGETKITVPKGVTGIGGRNTHLCLSLLPELTDDQVFVSVASDGKDNCNAAGAIVDKNTLMKAREQGLDYNQYHDNFDSYNFFDQTGDLLHTELLESNVADLMLLLTPESNKL